MDSEPTKSKASTAVGFFGKILAGIAILAVAVPIIYTLLFFVVFGYYTSVHEKEMKYREEMSDITQAIEDANYPGIENVYESGTQEYGVILEITDDTDPAVLGNSIFQITQSQPKVQEFEVQTDHSEATTVQGAPGSPESWQSIVEILRNPSVDNIELEDNRATVELGTFTISGASEPAADENLTSKEVFDSMKGYDPNLPTPAGYDLWVSFHQRDIGPMDWYEFEVPLNKYEQTVEIFGAVRKYESRIDSLEITYQESDSGSYINLKIVAPSRLKVDQLWAEVPSEQVHLEIYRQTSDTEPAATYEK